MPRISLNRCDDLVELFNYATVKSDQLMTKIEERHNNRQEFECVARTIEHMVDSVSSSISSKLQNNSSEKAGQSFFQSLIVSID